MALISMLMVAGLVLVSCGSKCPGGGSSGDKGNCVRDYTNLPVELKVCTNSKCGVYTSTSTTSKVTCDC